MEIFTFLKVLMIVSSFAMSSRGALLQPKWDSAALSYWQSKLPNTSIPNSLRELIVPLKGPKSAAVKPLKAVYPIYYSKFQFHDEGMLLDPSLLMFFLEKNLHTGNKLSLYLGKRSEHVYFLPRNLSDKIPFSSDKLSVALEDLNITEGSKTALNMKRVIQMCELPKVKEERTYCATSLESMIDFSTSRLGTNNVNVLVTNVPKSSVKQQQYTFTAILLQSKSGSKSVVCHSQAYAYAVYYCHEPKNIKVAKVSLKGEDGTRATGIAMCHEDTSAWNPNFVGFKMLNVKPGGPSVCHFLSEDDVVWLTAT